jgi:hypothetical protein
VTGAGQEGGYRVTWVPGSDHLHGICHCGADRVSEDPIELWTWLHHHPVGHGSAGGPTTDDGPPSHSNALVPMPVGITP